MEFGSAHFTDYSVNCSLAQLALKHPPGILLYWIPFSMDEFKAKTMVSFTAGNNG